MKQTPCVGCGARITAGYVFDQPAIRICTQCRDVWLTYLGSIGQIMADTNWLVNELCEDSHYLPTARYTYYDNLTQSRGKVLRLAK